MHSILSQPKASAGHVTLREIDESSVGSGVFLVEKHMTCQILVRCYLSYTAFALYSIKSIYNLQFSKIFKFRSSLTKLRSTLQSLSNIPAQAHWIIS